jgi:hypothetical protein
MISLKLLNKILDFAGKEATSFEMQGTSLMIHLEPTDIVWLNVFELSSMCKVYAKKYHHYTIETSFIYVKDLDGKEISHWNARATGDGKRQDSYRCSASNEFKVVFDVCEWILDKGE